jgi:predicted Fe-Mo cluster-binding NifX family protein
VKKVAVASEDGVNISHHFGRSRCFLVFEVEDKQVIAQSVRDNTFTAHARGECQEGVEHQHHHGHGAVLCYGMGWRAAEELKQNGIQAFILPNEMSPEEAVRIYLSGILDSAGGFCRCHG